jgi:hypothetical protein
VCLPSQLHRKHKKRITVQASPDKNKRPYPKNTKAKMATGMAQVIEHLPKKHEALSSKPGTTHTHTHTHIHIKKDMLECKYITQETTELWPSISILRMTVSERKDDTPYPVRAQITL